MPATAPSHRLRVLAAPGARHDEILTRAALDFAGRLTAGLAGRRQALLRERPRQARRLADGVPLDFPVVTSAGTGGPARRDRRPAGPPRRRVGPGLRGQGAGGGLRGQHLPHLGRSRRRPTHPARRRRGTARPPAGHDRRPPARLAPGGGTPGVRREPDREALVSAVAAEGYRELAEHLAEARPAPSPPDELASVAVAYVRFALDHPALFRAMFAEPCDPTSEERGAAANAIHEYVRTIVRATFPGVDAETLSTTVWALVHGLAFLHLDGKLDSSTPEAVTVQVTGAVRALFGASPALTPEARR